jgi:type I restriction-modification system DNA methylase subunit
MGEYDYTSLCNHLWEAANILRGPVDAADLKTYIFPLLFFNRVSEPARLERDPVHPVRPDHRVCRGTRTAVPLDV